MEFSVSSFMDSNVSTNDAKPRGGLENAEYPSEPYVKIPTEKESK
jgi:hypothetical protein